MLDSNSNARAWYEYALKTGDDSVARFMMHWIAFNWLYGDYDYGERVKIETLCTEKFEVLKRYDPFDDAETIDIFLQQPVDRPNYHIREGITVRGPAQMSPQRLYEVVTGGEGLERIQCLLLTIYQVRCNLFHGSKNPDVQRDQMLIQSAATIMQGYMEALLHINRR